MVKRGGILMSAELGFQILSLGFQVLNTAIIIAIPIVIYKVIKNHRTRRSSIGDRISKLEMSISLKAVRLAWIYTIIFLLIWVIYDYINTKKLGLPFLLLITQNIILNSVQLFLKWNIVKDEK